AQSPARCAAARPSRQFWVQKVSVGDAKAGMRRRDFVTLGSAALLSSLIPSRTVRAAGSAGLAEPARLPIAYWSGRGSALGPAASLTPDRSLLGRHLDLTGL